MKQLPKAPWKEIGDGKSAIRVWTDETTIPGVYLALTWHSQHAGHPRGRLWKWEAAAGTEGRADGWARSSAQAETRARRTGTFLHDLLKPVRGAK